MYSWKYLMFFYCPSNEEFSLSLWLKTQTVTFLYTKLSQSASKECRSIVRDESSVYFNVTAKHV